MPCVDMTIQTNSLQRHSSFRKHSVSATQKRVSVTTAVIFEKFKLFSVTFTDQIMVDFGKIKALTESLIHTFLRLIQQCLTLEICDLVSWLETGFIRSE